MDPNKRSKTNGPRRMMRSASMMYEKLDTMLEAIILEKKAREVEREEEGLKDLKEGREGQKGR